MDAVWGTGGTSYGDIGSDGIAVEVKNSYADFNLGGLNAKVGTQGAVIQRGFIFDDDMSGIVLSSAPVTFLYAKVEENGINTGDDTAMYHVKAAFDLDTVKLTPALTYIDGDDSTNVYYLGVDVDATLDMLSLWGTFIYSGGEIGADGANDVSGFLLAAGGTFKLSDTMDIHGQAFYATGDDPDDADADSDAFYSAPGQCWYWSEIMGYGIFDNQVSNNSPDCLITNITALNLGVTVKPMDKLSLSFDVWYATLNEVTAGADEDLGIEVDFVATYQLVEGLNLDVVGAYLFADDGTTGGGSDDENAYEVGTRLSLSF
jgi:hypothetical protein